jgi:hypothetical protein
MRQNVSLQSRVDGGDDENDEIDSGIGKKRKRGNSEDTLVRLGDNTMVRFAIQPFVHT